MSIDVDKLVESFRKLWIDDCGKLIPSNSRTISDYVIEEFCERVVSSVNQNNIEYDILSDTLWHRVELDPAVFSKKAVDEMALMFRQLICSSKVSHLNKPTVYLHLEESHTVRA